MVVEKETNTIHIRMGNDYKFISTIFLNDGTRLVNMQCSLLEPVPTNEILICRMHHFSLIIGIKLQGCENREYPRRPKLKNR